MGASSDRDQDSEPGHVCSQANARMTGRQRAGSSCLTRRQLKSNERGRLIAAAASHSGCSAAKNAHSSAPHAAQPPAGRPGHLGNCGMRISKKAAAAAAGSGQLNAMDYANFFCELSCKCSGQGGAR